MTTSRFDYVRFDDERQLQCGEIRRAAESLEQQLETLEPGRAKSLAMTKLEECYMWAGKACRDEQVATGGDAADVPERGE